MKERKRETDRQREGNCERESNPEQWDQEKHLVQNQVPEEPTTTHVKQTRLHAPGASSTVLDHT